MHLTSHEHVIGLQKAAPALGARIPPAPGSRFCLPERHGECGRVAQSFEAYRCGHGRYQKWSGGPARGGSVPRNMGAVALILLNEEIPFRFNHLPSSARVIHRVAHYFGG
jgi:hypothetical protein